MLLPRILSAIVMVAVFTLGLVFLNALGFMLFIGVVVMLASWEWARLSHLTTPRGRLAFTGLVATLIYGVAIFDLSLHVLWLSPVLWLVALLWVVRYPRPAFWQPILVRLIFGMAIMVTTWSALVVLKQQPHFLTWILLLMGLIWGADSGAYFTGRRFGRTKLARRVSPGKSWEGVIGGVVVTQVGVSLFAYSQHWSLEQAFVLAFIALVTVLVSVLGDLTESMFKRHEGVKDSGHLIPGHGGVMDRVDSLTSAAPIFVLLLLLFGLFSWL